MVVNHNIPALSTYNVINSTSNALQKSINKLSTGLRINSAADDAAGLAISEKMRAQVRGLDQAVSNSQDGISMIQTAEGALSETHSILQRMRELSVQAANDTLTQQDRGYIQEEVDQLREEITRIGNTTQFNKKKLLNGDAAVLWSSDNAETKAIVNGGLRTIDQFGQKSSAEGNYKIQIKATAGQGEVQKTDLFKIKHNTTPNYAVEGTNDYEGAALSARDGSVGPEFGAQGQRKIMLSYGGQSASVTLNTSLENIQGLADEIQGQLVASGKPGLQSATVSVDATGKRLNITLGDTTTSGALTITDLTTGSLAKWEPGNASDDVKDILGATADALNDNMVYTYTGNTATNLAAAAGSNRTFQIKANGNALATVALGSAAYTNAQLASKINEALEGYSDYAGGKLSAAAYSNTIRFTSEVGAISITDGTTPGAANGFGLGGKHSVSMTSENIDTDNLNYEKAVAGSTFKLVVGSSTKASATVSVSKTANTAQDVVDDINTALTNAGITNASARVITDEDGIETVRVFAEGSGGVSEITVDDSLSSGSVDVIFGKGTMTSLGASDIGASDGKAETTEVAGGIEDIASSLAATTFNIMSEDGKTKLGTISLKGSYKDDPKNGLTAADALVNDLNAKLKDAGLTDFEASLVDDDKGMDAKGKVPMKKLQLASGTRDFMLEVPTGGDAETINKLFGKDTNVNADKLDENVVGTIGMVASENTSLRDIDKFWDSEGNFLLEDPQTLTLTQGDGKQATVTLYEYDTVGSMAEKINNAIANDLGQAQYLDKSDKNYADALNKFASFVNDDPAENDDPNSESVKGTMLIRSINPGATGTISFSGNEALVNALSLNTIQSAKESQYRVTVQDAHTGKTVVDDAKITGNKLVGALHENVDVEFDAMAGIKATWDNENNKFTFTDNTTNPKADPYTTYLHLSDNTTVFQIGANEGEDMGINIGDMRSHALGLDEVNVTNRERAARSITVIDNAIDKVSMQRSKLGAYQNRLEHTINNLTTASENLTAAESRIRDTDMAKEMMNFSKLQIMLQAGNSMLAQANQLPQNVLSLVR
jgi:flagellin-like hook-associated protein FlgL